MGIPSTASQFGDLYIEYCFESVLFRYEKPSGRYFMKFYNESNESEISHDHRLLADAWSSGVLTTAERYSSEGASDAEPPDSFARMAVKHQRTRPYWLSVSYQGNFTRSGTIEVARDGRLEVVQAADSIRQLLEESVSDINSQPSLTVTYGDESPITVEKYSKEYELALRLELKRRELAVYGESSYYRGRSIP